MIPYLPGVEAGCLLLVWDVSGTIYEAYHSAGIGGILSVVAGRLRKLLTEPHPAWVVAALDTPGSTWRHRLTAGLEPRDRYKAQRPPRPEGWAYQIAQVEELIALHNVPLLGADGYEADDAWAWAVARGRALGVPAVGWTRDKDWTQLVTDDWPPVATWDGEKLTDEAAVLKRWGVVPALLGDLLAVVGDASDNISGVDGLGPEKAANLLNSLGGLERALEASPVPFPDDKQIDALARSVATAKRKGADPVDATELARLRGQRALAKQHAALLAQADRANLARKLIALDAEGPFYWNPELLPVGGFRVEELTQKYRSLGFTNMAAELGG